MRFAYSVLTVAMSVFASQVFFTGLSEDLSMSENIFLARVEGIVNMPMNYMNRADYTLSVLEIIACSDSLSDSLVGVYTMILPGSYISPSGEEVWESPIVNGSGLEFLVHEGDTVLVFGSAMPSGDTSVQMDIVRLEFPDSLGRLRELLSQ